MGDCFETAWAPSQGVFKTRFDKNIITYTYNVEIADEAVLLSLLRADIPLIFGFVSKYMLIETQSKLWRCLVWGSVYLHIQKNIIK